MTKCGPGGIARGFQRAFSSIWMTGEIACPRISPLQIFPHGEAMVHNDMVGGENRARR